MKTKTTTRMINTLKGFHGKDMRNMVLSGLRMFFCLICILTCGCRPEGAAVDVSTGHLSTAKVQKNEPITTSEEKTITSTDSNLDQPDFTVEKEKDENADLVNHSEPHNYHITSVTNEENTSPEVTPESIETTAGNITELQLPGETTDVTQNIPPVTQTTSELVTPMLPVLIDPNLADNLISVNFDQTDIRLVLKTISEITGINFIVDDNIDGTVTVLSPTQIPLGDLYNFLESILEVKGFVAIPMADHVKIVQRSNASKHNLHVRVGCDPAYIPQNDSVVTQLMPLKYADAVEVGNILAGRLSSDAQLATYSRTNTVIVTGTSANIHHIAKIIQQLDVSNAKEISTVVPLNYASAQVLSTQITDIIQKNQNVSGRSRQPGQTLQIQTGILIKPDQRTNSLIVTANQQDTKIIMDLVHQLDIERPAGTDNIHVMYLKNAQAKEVAEPLRLALAGLADDSANGAGPGVNITPEESTNSLIFTSSQQDFKLIAAIIDKLDIIREQVLVEMQIIEVREENLLEIGIDWATLDQAVSESVRAFGNTNFGIRVDAAQGDLEGLSIGAFKEIGGQVKIGAILSALEQQSGINVLSTPQIVTSNHRQAKFIVGENIPYVEQSRITESDPLTPTVIKTFKYKDVGITLDITPHISQGGQIRLEIDSAFTQIIESVPGLSTDTPTTSNREITTEISMADGATIIIGGLIREDKIKLENKIPLLGDLPLVGGLFKLKRDRLQKTNLLIFITPHILRSPEEMAEMTKRKRIQITPGFIQNDTGKNIYNKHEY
ncbi:MAG: type II secretion system secretin GspD [Sedimentisphaerales bacterium]|nr:type II secretion system secretin GspD [Sedimentisphaerales bacterium]